MQKKIKWLNTVFRPPIFLVVRARSSNGIVTHEWRVEERLQRGQGNGCCGLFLVAICFDFFFCSNQFIVLTSAFFRCVIFIQPPEKVKGFIGCGCVFAYTFDRA